eukprot:5791950-Amphidinium_carterae.1
MEGAFPAVVCALEEHAAHVALGCFPSSFAQPALESQRCTARVSLNIANGLRRCSSPSVQSHKCASFDTVVLWGEPRAQWEVSRAVHVSKIARACKPSLKLDDTIGLKLCSKVLRPCAHSTVCPKRSPPKLC